MEDYKSVLSSISERIQRSLFPFLEEEHRPLTEKQRKLISILEIIRIEDSIMYTYKTGSSPADEKIMGDPTKDTGVIIRRLITFGSSAVIEVYKHLYLFVDKCVSQPFHPNWQQNRSYRCHVRKKRCKVQPASVFENRYSKIYSLLLVKKSLEFDYPPPKALAFRRIHGDTTVIFFDRLRHSHDYITTC